ncbi:hypothetical protein STEG23_030819, partial [Scotinomys teguina]
DSAVNNEDGDDDTDEEDSENGDEGDDYDDYGDQNADNCGCRSGKGGGNIGPDNCDCRSGKLPLHIGWALTGAPLRYPVVALCHGGPSALILLDQFLHVLQQFIDGMGVGLDQLIALVLGLGGNWIRLFVCKCIVEQAQQIALVNEFESILILLCDDDDDDGDGDDNDDDGVCACCMCEHGCVCHNSHVGSEDNL